MISPRDEGIIQANLGRIQGLAQGLDFFIEQYNTGQDVNPKSIGFQLVPQGQSEFDEEEEGRVPKQG